MHLATRKSASAAWTWLSLIPIAGIIAIAWLYLAPRLITPINPDEIARLFVSDKIWQCAPEQLEQLRYLLVISLTPLLFWLGFVFTRFYPLNLPENRVVRWAAVLVQVIALGFVYKNWAFQNAVVHPYVNRWYIPRTLLIVAVLVAGFKLVRRNFNFSRLFQFQKLPVAFAALLTLVALAPSFAFEQNLFAQHSDTYHMPFTMDEFAAVLNGRTVWVNFFPQYQAVLPYLVAPFFMLFGFTVTTYTLAMVILGWICLLSIFFVFSQLSKSRWAGFSIYALWLAFVFFPTWPRGTWHETIFTYFQVGPLRYFAPFVLALLTLRSLRRGTFGLYLLTFVVGTWGALNNADFGLPALAGAFAALVMAREDRIKISVSFTLGIFSAIGAYFLFTYFRSGIFPLFQDIIAYQRAFAIYGFCMIPMPAWGLHWMVCATHLAAILTGVTMVFRRAPNTKPDLLAGMLIFAGFFGCGNLMYYVGRSHWAVLISCFPAWGLSIALLALHQWQNRASPRNMLQAIPSAFLALIVILMVPQLGNFTSPLEQIQRLQGKDPSFSERQQAMVDLIKKFSKSGEKVAVIYPWGHRLAIEARVENIFPFAQDESLILIAQLQRTYDAILNNHVGSVFGLFPKEIADWLNKNGFVLQETMKSGFTAWTKKNSL